MTPARARHPVTFRNVALGCLAALILAIGWTIWTAPAPFERSAMGSQGLVTWLRANRIEAVRATGSPIRTDRIALRILPLLDQDLSRAFVPPRTREAYLATGTERDITPQVVRAKLQSVPSLLVAPKWTRAVRLSGYAHASLLLPAQDVHRVLRLATQRSLRIWQSDSPIIDAPVSATLQAPDTASGAGQTAQVTGQITLYAPQLFAPDLPDSCAARLSLPQGVLLARCDALDGGPAIHVLSDPDLLNNHGLALGGNAALALAMVPALSGRGAVVIDTTARMFTTSDPRLADQTRSLADLLRFFAWPFSVLWVGLGLLALLAVWRGAVRFGPPRAVFDDRQSPARATSIAAQARILRMAGGEHLLVKAHVEQRLRMICAALAGPGGQGDQPERRIIEILRRRDPALAEGFAAAATAATTQGPAASPARLQVLLEDFELQAERVLDGSRRV